MEQPRQRTATTPEAPVVDREVFDALLMQFDAALRALADTGERDAACRIAAQAWSATRHHSRRADRRLTATLHYLALPEYSTSRRAAARADDTITH